MRNPGTLLSRASIVAFAVLIVGAPANASTGHRNVVNAVKSCTRTGTCCKEMSSICNAGGPEHMDYYYKTSGSCDPY